MKKHKFNGFTLPEVLITLAIVGIVAALVLPGVIKDIKMRANMALLQSTVVNLSDVVQQEIIRTRAKNIEDTKIYTDPQYFLTKNFDYAKEGPEIFKTLSDEGEYSLYSYSHLDSPYTAGGSTNPTSQVILKNGVYIGIYKTDTNRYFVIDINGPEKPNIVGIDYFALDIAPEDVPDAGIRMGDVGAFMVYAEMQLEDLKTECRTNGIAQACYALAERSGFDPNYMEK